MSTWSRRRLFQTLGGLALAPAVSASATALSGDSPEVVRRSAALPSRPMRVVVLEFAFAEMLLQLDIVPVGMPELKLYKTWINVGVDRLDQVMDVGTRQQPNLETIALLNPDLIIGIDYRHLALFDLLERIAPTIMMRYAPGAGGRTQLEHTVAGFRALGTLVNRAERVEPAVKALDKQLVEDHLALQPLSGTPVAVMHNLGLGQMFWAYAGNSMAAGLAYFHGLKYWPDIRPEDGLSYVRVDQMIAQTDLRLLLIDFHKPDPESTLSDPLWKLVPANRDGHLALIAPNIWGFGGLVSAGKLSATLREQLLQMPA